ncbi:daptide-type RiPP [Streptomyces sp. NPDC002054]|uniref:daptide-type RiPP n=1 Tax=Streptomyces sp. NPDC002054 TaxID=3154663 RepID=UPI00331D3E92
MQDIFEKDAIDSLELGMQELEAMEAPGVWSNFKDGVTVSVAASAIYGSVATAVAVT